MVIFFCSKASWIYQKAALKMLVIPVLLWAEITLITVSMIRIDGKDVTHSFVLWLYDTFTCPLTTYPLYGSTTLRYLYRAAIISTRHGSVKVWLWARPMDSRIPESKGSGTSSHQQWLDPVREVCRRLVTLKFRSETLFRNFIVWILWRLNNIDSKLIIFAHQISAHQLKRLKLL